MGQLKTAAKQYSNELSSINFSFFPHFRIFQTVLDLFLHLLTILLAPVVVGFWYYLMFCSTCNGIDMSIKYLLAVDKKAQKTEQCLAFLQNKFKWTCPLGVQCPSSIVKCLVNPSSMASTALKLNIWLSNTKEVYLVYPFQPPLAHSLNN